MKVYGRGAISYFLGDFIVYRSLEAMDVRLPRLVELRQMLNLPEEKIPRKIEPEYASVIVSLLKQARALEGSQARIERLLYIGDTQLLDGTAFSNICETGGWPGLAFIGSENSLPLEVDIADLDGKSLYLSNRWHSLLDPEGFPGFIRDRSFPIDSSTGVLVDLDKTALGGRGRNGIVIDQARMQAVQETVAGLLGEEFNLESFQEAYNLLNLPEFHAFTTDNQDYLAYICLVLECKLFSLDQFVDDIRHGWMASFNQFIQEVNERRFEMPSELEAIHSKVYENVLAGDPTPFKAFRRNEYLATVRRMGSMDDSIPVEQLMKNEIVITHEVQAACRSWLEQGALLFGLSDKPDEAAIPSPELVIQGYHPLHRVKTHIVGE